MKRTHINVTVDLSNRKLETYDLRIPIQLTVKQLLINIQEALNIEMIQQSQYAIKVTTKDLFLADDDYLRDYYVTDGDIIVIL